MKGGHAEVVKFLLSQGAKVSAYLDTYNSIILKSYRSSEIFDRNISLIKKLKVNIFVDT